MPTKPHSEATTANHSLVPFSHDGPRSIDLVWTDPVTGLDLELEISACPEVIKGLLATGFRPKGAQPGPESAFEAA